MHISKIFKKKSTRRGKKSIILSSCQRTLPTVEVLTGFLFFWQLCGDTQFSLAKRMQSGMSQTYFDENLPWLMMPHFFFNPKGHVLTKCSFGIWLENSSQKYLCAIALKRTNFLIDRATNKLRKYKKNLICLD
jgi:hypothetical protein